MSRKSTLGPGWLVGLLTRWVKRDVKSWSGGLGYPSQALFLGERVDCAGCDYNDLSLWGYDSGDFKAVDKAMHELAITKPELFAAVNMYYRPWTIPSLVESGYPYSPCRTYYDRLHAAHKWLASILWEVESKYNTEECTA